MVKAIRDGIAAQVAAKAEAAAPPVTGEIAASRDGRDITMNYMMKIRPSQDTVLNKRGGNLEIYEELLRDPQVFSCFQQRRTAVTSREWDVESGAKDKLSEMAADFMREQLENFKFDDTTNKMLYGLFHGYSVGECMFVQDGKHVLLDDILVRKARRFRFDDDHNLRLLTRDNMVEGEVMPDRKFWVFRAGSDNDDEPYGLGLGHQCYWPVWFKNNGIKFWAMYLDKFGMPTSVGEYPVGTSKEDQAKLLAAISAVQSDSGVIIPEGMIIKLLEATRSGSSDNKPFHDTMNDAIAKVILSQTMTTDAKSTGLGSAQGKAHEGVKDDVVKGDADLICSSFNESVAVWLTAWNFPGAVPPKVWRDIEPAEDLSARAERDTKIMGLGFKPTPEYIKETYGEGWEEKAEPQSVLPGLPGNPFPGKKAAANEPSHPDAEIAFAEAQAALNDAVSRLTDQAEAAGAKAIDAFIGEIRDLLDTAFDLPEFQRLLLEHYPEMKVDGIAALIRDAMIVADLTGRADQQDGK